LGQAIRKQESSLEYDPRRIWSRWLDRDLNLDRSEAGPLRGRPRKSAPSLRKDPEYLPDRRAGGGCRSQCASTRAAAGRIPADERRRGNEAVARAQDWTRRIPQRSG